MLDGQNGSNSYVAQPISYHIVSIPTEKNYNTALIWKQLSNTDAIDIIMSLGGKARAHQFMPFSITNTKMCEISNTVSIITTPTL